MGQVADLLLRWWGWGPELVVEEKDVLLRALDEENKSLRGSLHLKALERLRERGVR